MMLAEFELLAIFSSTSILQNTNLSRNILLSKDNSFHVLETQQSSNKHYIPNALDFWATVYWMHPNYDNYNTGVTSHIKITDRFVILR